MPVKIFIFGSCVSRDIFNFDDNARYELVDYRARSSLGSCFTPSSTNGIQLNRLSSAFQRRIVKTDIEATLPTLLKKTDYDIFLLDVIDERFDLYVDKIGGVCTLSNELYATGFEPTNMNGDVVESGSALFINMWLSGWRKLVATLRKQGKINQLRINEVYWSYKSKDGKNFLPTYSVEKIEQANKFLEILYSHMRLIIPESQFLRADASLFVGATDHLWGRSPFHYESNYYYEMLNKIQYSLSLASSAKDNFKKIIQTDTVTSQNIEKIEEKSTPRFSFETNKYAQLEAKAFFDGSRIRAQSVISPTSEGIDSVLYAFYLLKNDQRIAVRWYETKKEVFFDIEKLDENLEVVAFAQDQLGSKLITRTPVTLHS